MADEAVDPRCPECDGAVGGGGSAADRPGALVALLIPMGTVAAVVAGAGYVVGSKGAA